MFGNMFGNLFGNISKHMSEHMCGNVFGNMIGNRFGSICVVLGTCVTRKGSYGAPVLNVGHSARI